MPETKTEKVNDKEVSKCDSLANSLQNYTNELCRLETKQGYTYSMWNNDACRAASSKTQDQLEKCIALKSS
jgi:hypothetical protein